MTFNWMNLNESFDGDGDGGDGGADAAATAAAEAAARAAADADGAGDGKGGKPSDAEAKLLKEVMEKKEALTKAKDAAKQLETAKAELEAKLARFDGIDVDEVAKLLQERKDRETAELEKRGEWDRLKAQMLEAHTKELETIKSSSTGRVKELEDALSKHAKEIHELTIGRSFSESPFIREGLTLTPSKARVIYGSHFELQDGKVVAFDKPVGVAERTMLIDGDGNPLAFDKAIEKLVELDPDRDNLLRSKIKSGSGSENDPAARGKDRKEDLRGRERILAAIKSGGLKPIIK